jgi:hypothetical protein
MPYVQDMVSLQGDPGQPLIGIITEQQGEDVVRYFTREQEADTNAAESTTEDALSLSGAWSDLEWEELEKALARIRRESVPTPPFSL